MKVDIILVSYNQESYICRAIESILVQQIDGEVDVRVIIADDCSTDKTLEIIKSYEIRSPFPFVYVENEYNVGHIRNYQRAFLKCQGEYILILEGDDYWSSPLHVNQHVNFLKFHIECSVSINKLAIYYEDDKRWMVRNNCTCSAISYVDITMQISENYLGNHSACCYRTDLIKQLPELLFEEYFDDWFLGMWLCQFGLIAQLDMVTSVYRIHNSGIYSSLSQVERNELDIKRLKFCKKILPEVYHSTINDSIALRMCVQTNQNNLRQWIPDILILLIKLLIPLAIRRKLKRLLKLKQNV